MPYVFVCDEAFALTTHQLRPFCRRGLDVRKQIFNFRLSRARRIVECAFGILTSKWRVFHTPLQLSVGTVDAVIKCACVLHNYILANGIIPDNGATLQPDANLSGNCLETCQQQTGWQIREAFANYLSSVEGGVPWQYGVLQSQDSTQTN